MSTERSLEKLNKPQNSQEQAPSTKDTGWKYGDYSYCTLCGCESDGRYCDDGHPEYLEKRTR